MHGYCHFSFSLKNRCNWRISSRVDCKNCIFLMTEIVTISHLHLTLKSHQIHHVHHHVQINLYLLALELATKCTRKISLSQTKIHNVSVKKRYIYTLDFNVVTADWLWYNLNQMISKLLLAKYWGLANNLRPRLFHAKCPCPCFCLIVLSM